MPQRTHEVCTVEGCDRAHYGNGYCNAHYQRVRNTGSVGTKPVGSQMPRDGRCSVDGCDRRIEKRGLCGTHYSRLRTKGDVMAHDPVGKHWRPDNPRRRTPGGSRHKNNDGYMQVWDPEHPNAHAVGWVLEHRRVMANVLGRPLYADEVVHHKNGDRTDNRPENLELCVKRQPPGQRVEDLMPWVREMMRRYGP